MKNNIEKNIELIANGIMIGVQANKYHTNYYDTSSNDFNHSHLMRAAKEGYELAVNDMMKDAIETTVKGYVGGDGAYVSVDLPPGVKIDEGDEVKVIIIKKIIKDDN